ncbi:hypothetical protein C8R47DRAFT_1078747 [Mycena vitilis]|nr:hypothetical protein C8R47DRAFT_1078747 [Mycena vitilis]
MTLCGGMWNIPRIGSRVDSDLHFAEAVEYSRGIGLGADIQREMREGVIDRCESEISWRGGDWVDGWTWRAKSGGVVTDWACGLAAGVRWNVESGDARGCNRPLRIRNFVARRRLGGRLDLAGEIRWCGDRLGVRARRWSQLGDLRTSAQGCGGMWNIPRIGSRVDSDLHFAEAVEYSRGIGLGADIQREMREGVIDRCESEISWRGGDWVDGWTWRAKSGGVVTDWACGLAAGVS